MHFETPSQEDMASNVKNLDLNKIMQNVGSEQFDYGTFKAAYDSDERVKTMVANFNEIGITPKTKNAPSELPQGDTGDADTVSKMAKRATDLGNDL